MAPRARIPSWPGAIDSTKRPEIRVQSRPTDVGCAQSCRPGSMSRRALKRSAGWSSNPNYSRATPLRDSARWGALISENDAPGCPTMQTRRGGRYLTPPRKCSLTRPGRGLWKLPGLWTRFEVHFEGDEPTAPWTRFEVQPRVTRPQAPTAHYSYCVLLETKTKTKNNPRSFRDAEGTGPDERISEGA